MTYLIILKCDYINTFLGKLISISMAIEPELLVTQLDLPRDKEIKKRTHPDSLVEVKGLKPGNSHAPLQSVDQLKLQP